MEKIMVLRTKHPVFTVTQNSRIGTRKVPHINLKLLQKICRMPIKDFAKYGEKVSTKEGLYFFQDNKAKILAIAHLDFVMGPLHFTTAKLHNDRRIFCPNLDDRLGVYAVTEYLNNLLKMKYDILLTTGEERMRSTAAYFLQTQRNYNWMFSVDRAGTDSVTYQYKNIKLDALLAESGWRSSVGSYSDIVELEHLGCKGINFGAGYYLQHTENSYASEMDFLANMTKIKLFYDSNKDKVLEHLPLYNVYSEEDGFGRLNTIDPFNADFFSKNDIDFIGKLIAQHYDFGNSLVRKSDLFLIRKEVEEADLFLKQFEGQKKSQLKLIKPSEDSKEYNPMTFKEAKNKTRTNLHVLPFIAVTPEENRKILNVHFPIEEAIVMSTGTENQEELEDAHNRATLSGHIATAPTECTTCHRIFEAEFGAKTTQCSDCVGDTDTDTNTCLRCEKEYVIAYGANNKYCSECLTEIEAVTKVKLQAKRSITIPFKQKTKGWLYEIRQDGTWGWTKYEPGTPEYKEYFEDIEEEFSTFKEIYRNVEEEISS